MSISPIRRAAVYVTAAVTLLLAVPPPAAALAGNPPAGPVQTGAVVSREVHRDVSPPLRDILDNQQDQQGQHGDHAARAYRPARPHSSLPGTPSSSTAAAVPPLGQSFDGVGNGFSGPSGTFTVASAPPDTNLAVGPNHLVEIVNTDFAIFNKTGAALYGPVAINTLWSGFGGNCQTDNDGDPIAKYDSIADRWVISQFAVTTPNPDYLQCVAVSQTPDPTGAYYRYSFSYGSQFPDYPKMSVWPDAYYITFNMFNSAGTTFLGPTACAYDRSSMLSGAAATQQCFSLSTVYGALLPSDFDGAQQPPGGSPNYIVADGAQPNELAYWRFHTDWATPANTTLTGPTTIATAPFSAPCVTCVPQAGTSQQLDTLGDRLMYRFAYRNFGDHEGLVVNRSVTAGSSIGVRWYELRTGAANSLSLYQQGTYAPDSNYRWMGSIAQDQSGDTGLGFSVSGGSIHPGIHYTGRLAGDPLGTMTQSEGTVIDGAGSQRTNLSRWGDYSALAVDPADGCTFWYANEYIPSNGTFNWKTRIASFRFPSCGAPPPVNDFSISAAPASATVNQGVSATYSVSTATTTGAAQTVTFSATGLPGGATAIFNPGSVTSGGSSTLTVTTSTTTPGGTYPITVTGTGSSAHSTSVTLVVNGPTGIANGGFEAGVLSGWTSTGSTSVSTTSHSGAYAAMVGSTSPTNGDSTIAQTFTAPASSGPLTFWYRIVCPDTIAYDWASASLKDNTAGTTSTLLANTCSNSNTWVQSSPATVVGGHSYTLTLLSHDDNWSSDPTYTLFDDVQLAAPPAPDFTISANPSSQSVTQGGTTTYTVTIAAQNGFKGTVNLSATGATSSFNPTSVSGFGTSALTVTAPATPGSFPISITGTSGTLSHGTSVSLTVTPPPDFTISASPASQSVTQGNGTTYTVTITAQNGFAGPTNLTASGFAAGASGVFNPASVIGSGTATLMVSTTSSAATGSSNVTITGSSGTLSHAAGVTLVVSPPQATVIVNGGFEAGSLSGWVTAGSTAISSTSHSGGFAAQVGSGSPFNGDSSISQTFTTPSGSGHLLRFWYRVVCTDTVTYDWGTATLKDNTSNTTATVLARTCSNSGTWAQKTVNLTGSRSYTLTLINHDDNYPGDPTYTLYDDVSVT